MKKNTAFYIEILALLLILIFGTTVVIQIFGHARKMSIDAAQLANAVPIAHNAAEAFTAGEGDLDYVRYFDASGTECEKADAYYAVTLQTTEQPEKSGVMKDAVITITQNDQIIYELQAKKYVPQEN